jgi:hypothetical protein
LANVNTNEDAAGDFPNPAWSLELPDSGGAEYFYDLVKSRLRLTLKP